MFSPNSSRALAPALAGTACLLFAASDLSASTLALYSFSGATTAAETGAQYSPTVADPNVVASAISDPTNSIAIEISNAATTPANAPYLRIDPQGSSTDATGAVANNKYFQFTLAPSAGYLLNLSSLTFNVARGGAGTPRGYVVRSSADNFAANLAQADIDTARPTYTPVSLDLTGSSFQGLSTSGITFRVYSYAPTAGNSVDYDDIAVNGGAVVVPEPASLGLVALGLAGLALRRRSR